MDGTFSTHKEDYKCIQHFWSESEGKEQIEKNGRRRKETIEMNVKEVLWESVKINLM
jgi:hypothetical protein